jgi:hypothetical protein
VRNRLLLVSLLVCFGLGGTLGCSPKAQEAPTPTPQLANTLRPTFTALPSATATPAATATPTATYTPTATATPEPTATSQPTVTRVPPTPRPQPTNTPAPQVGPHGVMGRLRLRENRTDYAVNEKVFFVFEAENRTDHDIPFGILGMKASNGQFQTSWTSDVYSWKIDAHSTFSKDDNIAFSEPGTYTVKLAICFSDYGTCQGEGADWEEFSPGVQVNIR